MYYIQNENREIIAADEEVLKLCEVATIDELSLNIKEKNIFIHVAINGNLTIETEKKEITSTASTLSLNGLSGLLSLVHVSKDELQTKNISHTHENIDFDDNTSLIDSIIYNEEGSEESLFSKTDVEENNMFNNFSEQSTDTTSPKDEEIFDLFGEDKKDDNVTPEPLKSNEFNYDAPEISINVSQNSQKIGISEDDYQKFLDEFIDTALALEKNLQSSDEEERFEATNTLHHLAQMLHLFTIDDIVADIKNANETNQRPIIESFYETLSRITTTQNKEQENENPFPAPNITENFTNQKENTTPKKISIGSSFGSINLDGVQEKYFDFQPENAARELSLPVELIEEFIQDFIEQARSETKKMLQAYEDGDLDAIRKIGHLLKGTSSNLRITNLSDTLYKIQFCEDSSKLEMLIKDYWAHFLSFESQIKKGSIL